MRRCWGFGVSAGNPGAGAESVQPDAPADANAACLNREVYRGRFRIVSANSAGLHEAQGPACRDRLLVKRSSERVHRGIFKRVLRRWRPRIQDAVERRTGVRIPVVKDDGGGPCRSGEPDHAGESLDEQDH